MQASGIRRSLDEVLPRPDEENDGLAKASDDGAGMIPGDGAGGEIYDDRGATRGTEPGALEAQGGHPYQTRGAAGRGF